MSIKTISLKVNVDGISPNVEQFGGTMGDHRVTRLEFTLSDELFNALQNDYPNKNFYRFDIYDGGGGMHTSAIEQITDKTVCVELEEKHTRYGGKISVYLILTALSDNNETQIELYSFPVKLQLKGRPDGIQRTTENYESIAGVFENIKAVEKRTELNAKEANISAEMAHSVLGDVKDTVEAALEQAKSSGMFDGVSATHSWDGTVLTVTSASGTSSANLKGDKGDAGADAVTDQTYSPTSENAQSGTAVAEAINEFKTKYDNTFAQFDSRLNDANNYTIKVDKKLDNDYYTKTQINNFNYADKKYVDESIVNVNTNGKVELQNYYTKQECDNTFAQFDIRLKDANNYTLSVDMKLDNDYYTKSQINNLNYADKQYVDSAIENVNTGNSVIANYNDLLNKPQINGVELTGNKALGDLGIEVPTKLSEFDNDKGFIDSTSLNDYYTKTDIENFNYANKDYVDKAISDIDISGNDETIKIDQEYSPQSTNAQSGTAVAEALSSYYTANEVDSFDYANKAYVDEAITSVNTGGTVDLSNYYTKSEVNNLEGVKHIRHFNNSDHIVIFETSNFMNNNSSYIELSDYSGIGLCCAKDDEGNTLTVKVNGSVINGVGYPILKTDAANKQYVDDAVASLDTGSTVDLSDYYTKTETEQKITDGVNSAKLHTETLLNEGYYTKDEIDELNFADKSYVDEAVASVNTGGGVDLSDYYTKTEIDNLDYADKKYVDEAIAGSNNESATVDQNYNATSTNAQSGIAVAEAISTKADAETKTVDISCFSGMTQSLMTDGTYNELITNINFNASANITVFDFSNGLRATTTAFSSIDEIADTGYAVGNRYLFVVQNKQIVSMAQIQLISDKADKAYVDSLVGDIESLLGGI